MIRHFLAGSAALLLGACTVTAPSYLSAPADPFAPVPSSRYASVSGDAKPYRPVEPKSWEQLNRQVTPRGGS